MEKIELILQQILESQVKMQGDISGIKDEISSMKGEISSLKTNQERFERKLDMVIEQVGTLNEFKVTTNERFTQIDFKLDQISTDVSFIRNKSFQNEQAIFKIKETCKYFKIPVRPRY